MSEQPVQAGEPVTIQPAEPADTEQGDTNYAEQPDGSMVEQPPAAAVPVNPPPAGGPGEQSLAERQAGGEQAEADVPQPESGPGAGLYGQPAASYPAEEVTADDGQPWQPPVGNATSNESPMLPGNLTSGAARAHAALGKADEITSNGDLTEGERLSALGQLIKFAERELDRFLPTHVRQPAADEVNREL